MYGALDTATSALTAYRTQIDVVAGNIAMKDAMRYENGEPVPYRRRVALFAPGDPSRGHDAPGVHNIYSLGITGHDTHIMGHNHQ